MKLFLDTEFTDFIDCDLIAIGIVSEDGKEFYAERNEVDVGRCSAFVREVVLPLLGKEPAVIGSEEEIGQALKEWLAQFGEVEVCYDYAADFEFFSYLVRDKETLKMPSGIVGHNIKEKIQAAEVERYWLIHGRMAHHALHDARANCYAYFKEM